MSSWNSYNSSRFQVSNFFLNNSLKISQVEELRDILEVLAKYMIVDRDILNARAGKKIGLSHIQRALNLNLIVELKDFVALESKEELNNTHYFYKLGLAGINALSEINEQFQHFSILERFKPQHNVLMFNYDCLKNNYEFLFSIYNDLKHYRFFHCKDTQSKNVILYFKNDISITHIENIMKKIYISQLSDEQLTNSDEMFYKFISKFRFERIIQIESKFNKNMKADLDSYNSRLVAEQRFKNKK